MDTPIAYVQGNADTLAARGPVLFYGIVITNDSNGVGLLRVRDGLNVGAQEVMLIAASDEAAGGTVSETVAVFPPQPVVLRLGLFVDVVSNISRFTVFFLPVREEQVIPLAEEAVEGAAE